QLAAWLRQQPCRQRVLPEPVLQTRGDRVPTGSQVHDAGRVTVEPGLERLDRHEDRPTPPDDLQLWSDVLVEEVTRHAEHRGCLLASHRKPRRAVRQLPGLIPDLLSTLRGCRIAPRVSDMASL